ncbi:HK97 gp10 family phage protein [Acetobacter orientalis]|uniref:HK97 gp10 family phage protein n=1 Tax=Acetobacter orientalis TaxID=146474 RepID=A0A2Z5ZHQ9_9PROT|nr:HK97 gp10 family phage protein [Acetobacter orientalis]
MASIQLVLDHPGMLILKNDELKAELRAIGKEIQRRTKQLILAGASSPHKPSQAGAAPNSLTGTLSKQIRIKVTKNSVKIIDTARQALALEAGAHLWNGATVAPRPYLSTVLEQMTPDIERRLAAVLGIELKVNK